MRAYILAGLSSCCAGGSVMCLVIYWWHGNPGDGLACAALLGAATLFGILGSAAYL